MPWTYGHVKPVSARTDLEVLELAGVAGEANSGTRPQRQKDEAKPIGNGALRGFRAIFDLKAANFVEFLMIPVVPGTVGGAWRVTKAAIALARALELANRLSRSLRLTSNWSPWAKHHLYSVEGGIFQQRSHLRLMFSWLFPSVLSSQPPLSTRPLPSSLPLKGRRHTVGAPAVSIRFWTEADPQNIPATCQ